MRNPGLYNPEFSARNLESHSRLEYRVTVRLTKTGTQCLDSLTAWQAFERKWKGRWLRVSSRLVQWTPPYGHLVITATFFGRLAKTAIHFLVKKTLVNTAKFFDPLVTVWTGFHCTWNTKSTEWNPKFKPVLDSFPDFKMRHSQFTQRWRNTRCYYTYPRWITKNDPSWTRVTSCYFHVSR